ncbi:hypothetical protein Tco_0757668 [Tanacetum coccineum]
MAQCKVPCGIENDLLSWSWKHVSLSAAGPELLPNCILGAMLTAVLFSLHLVLQYSLAWLNSYDFNTIHYKDPDLLKKLLLKTSVTAISLKERAYLTEVDFFLSRKHYSQKFNVPILVVASDQDSICHHEAYKLPSQDNALIGMEDGGEVIQLPEQDYGAISIRMIDSITLNADCYRLIILIRMLPYRAKAMSNGGLVQPHPEYVVRTLTSSVRYKRMRLLGRKGNTVFLLLLGYRILNKCCNKKPLLEKVEDNGPTAEPLQKKCAFQMSVHEDDSFEIDDDDETQVLGESCKQETALAADIFCKYIWEIRANTQASVAVAVTNRRASLFAHWDQLPIPSSTTWDFSSPFSSSAFTNRHKSTSFGISSMTTNHQSGPATSIFGSTWDPKKSSGFGTNHMSMDGMEDDSMQTPTPVFDTSVDSMVAEDSHVFGTGATTNNYDDKEYGQYGSGCNANSDIPVPHLVKPPVALNTPVHLIQHPTSTFVQLALIQMVASQNNW